MLRPRKIEDDENTDRWLVSYADFITLLFAFFVVMYSISQVSEGKYRVLSESLLNAFDASDKKASSSNLSPIELPGNPTNPEVIKPLTEEQETAENYATPREFDRIEQQLTTQLDDLIKNDLVTVKKSRDWLEIDLRSALLFESGSDRLAASASLVLGEIADTLHNNQHLIAVRGHTDNIPIDTVRFRSNWELSAARAVSVVRLLQSLNIVPERLSAQGHGEFQPVASNDTTEGRAKNRRVTVAISRYKLAEEAEKPEVSVTNASSSETVEPQPMEQKTINEEQLEPQYEIVRLPNGGLLIRGKKLPEKGNDENDN